MWKRSIRQFSIGKDENKALLRRELLADVFQNSLKLGVYYLSHSQAMKAELMRSLLDAGNHMILYMANRWSRQSPDEIYSYGYSKFKNLAVILPGACFFLSGLYNMAAPLASFWMPHELSLTPLTLSLIMISSVGEFYVFYKNLGDIREEPSMNFVRRVYSRVALSKRIIMHQEKADPIQSTIVMENVLAMGGVSLPLITSCMCYITGIPWFDLVGEMLNGCVQLYLGSTIIIDNSRVLVGHSMPVDDVAKIRHILEEREDIDTIDTLKTEYLDSKSLKIAATIRYDSEEISDKVIEVLEKDIEQITQDEKEKEELRLMIAKSTGVVLTHTTEIIRSLEEDIQKEYPHIVEIDLEQSKDNIHEPYRGIIALTSSSSDDEDVK